MTTQPHATTSTTRPAGFLVALAPWVLFTVIDRVGSFRTGALVALLAAAVVAAPAVAAGRPKILEIGAVATFAGLSAVAFVVSAHEGHDIGLYARGIAAGALSLIAFASLLFTPFTEQYAREQVPSSLWETPRFKALNRRLTAMWGAIFATMVPFHVAGAVDTRRGNLLLNWVVPIALVMWGLKQTEAMTEQD